MCRTEFLKENLQPQIKATRDERSGLELFNKTLWFYYFILFFIKVQLKSAWRILGGIKSHEEK